MSEEHTSIECVSAEAGICENGHLVVALFNEESVPVAVCHLEAKAARLFLRKVTEMTESMLEVGEIAGRG